MNVAVTNSDSGWWGNIVRLARLFTEFYRSRGPRPVDYDWFTQQEVAGLDAVLSDENLHRIDDTTWRDVEGGRYLRFVGADSSILGRQMLYHRLRCGAQSDELRQLAHEATGSESSEVRLIRLKLRRIDTDVTDLFRFNAFVLPAWTRRLRFMPFASAVATVLLFTNFWIPALILLLACLAVGAAVHLHFYGYVARWHGQRTALLQILRCGLDLADLKARAVSPVLRPFDVARDEVAALISMFSPSLLSLVPGAVQYLNFATLHDLRELQRQSVLLIRHGERLRAVYEAIAAFDADACLVEHIARVDKVCWVEHSQSTQVSLVEVVNPLLSLPMPLTLHLDRSGAFITGQNGVGKSTLLRAIGLNLMSARAFGFCYAKAAATPRAAIYTSMLNEDNLEAGKSHYMAELSRAERLARVAGSANAVFLIDEPFRGTNHDESTAASSGWLAFLATRGLVIVSSHNVLLARLLEKHLTPIRLIASDVGDLRLEQGLLPAPNGLAMMERYDFNADIRRSAEAVMRWLSAGSAPSQMPAI